MPRPRKNRIVECTYFYWKLYKRQGVWYADGRSKPHNLGPHSLGTHDADEARRLLSKLDQQKAEDLGLAPKTKTERAEIELLPLDYGRRLYELHISGPEVTGGLQDRTKKKYRSGFNKLLGWLANANVQSWNQVTAELLTRYAAFLKAGGPADAKTESYADKSISNELTFAKQVVKWLIQAGHLKGMAPIVLKVRKPESRRPYCWRPEEVAVMVTHCRSHKALRWLGDVVIALACTGLRISELAGLRWSEVDQDHELLKLTDETGRSGLIGKERRRLKSGRSRSFPIHKDLLDVLGRQPKQGIFVFHGPRGGRLKPDTVRRLLIRHVLTPLAEKFPAGEGEQGFADGRLHSFRHFFCSTCANDGVPEPMLMEWLGHRDSEMVRHYYHVHDGEARRRMNEIDFLGGAADGPLRPKKSNVSRKRQAKRTRKP